MRFATLGMMVLLAGLACGRRDDQAVTDAEHPWRKPGDKIDSILPMDELVRRFRDGVPEVTRFEGGEESREQLARTFLEAVAHSDSARVRSLLISKAEFAWLLFPDHLYSKEPYALDPDIFWLQLTEETRKGSGRVLTRYGGRPLQFSGLTGCQRDTLQIIRGPDTVWTHCLVHYHAGDSTLTRMLFGSIVQRDGRAKFLSYHTEF